MCLVTNRIPGSYQERDQQLLALTQHLSERDMCTYPIHKYLRAGWPGGQCWCWLCMWSSQGRCADIAGSWVAVSILGARLKQDNSKNIWVKVKEQNHSPGLNFYTNFIRDSQDALCLLFLPVWKQAMTYPAYQHDFCCHQGSHKHLSL